MRIQILFLLLILVICTFAYGNVKSSDKEKALAYKEKKDKAVKEHKKDADGVEYKELSEVMEEAGAVQDYEEEEEEETEKPKKKIPVKKQKPKEKKADEEKPKKTKKTKKADPEMLPVPETAAIPNTTSFNNSDLTQENRIDKLREIINDTSTGDDIEKMRQITESVQDDIPDDDDGYVFQACTDNESELCHCDLDEINCSAIVMDNDDPHLFTADLAIQKKDFKPVVANFSENAIIRLHTGKVLPKFEKYVSILDMSFNQIRYIDGDVFKSFTNLSKLDLSHNSLQNIKKAVFDNAKDTLHRLDLGYNRLKTIPDNFFDSLANLKVLILDGNPIKTWKKEMFKGLDNLEELSLDDCKLDDLPADLFEYLPKLVGVSLRGNPLEEIPTAVTNSKSLKDLDMSKTNLTEIRDHAFAKDNLLEEIIMEQMKYLSVVRDCGFCGLPKLKILYLNDNPRLVEIHPNAFGYLKSEPGHKAAAITEFAIHNSNLSRISEHMLDYDKLDSFKLGGNPWNCGCETQFLLEEKMLFKADSVAPKCASPEAFRDKHLATVRVTDACESARFLGRSGRFSSVLGLALLAAFICIGSYYMVSSGKLEKLVRRVRKEPEVSYTNLQATNNEDFALEADFQPRPAEV